MIKHNSIPNMATDDPSTTLPWLSCSRILFNLNIFGNAANDTVSIR